MKLNKHHHQIISTLRAGATIKVVKGKERQLYMLGERELAYITFAHLLYNGVIKEVDGEYTLTEKYL